MSATSIRPHEIYVYNYRLDGYGHVNNARYLEFLEEARWDFFRQRGLLPELRQIQLVVSRLDIRYRAAAVLDDVLYIYSVLTGVQSRQIGLQQRIVRAVDQKLLVEAQVVLTPTFQGRIVKLPENLMAVLLALINTEC